MTDSKVTEAMVEAAMSKTPFIPNENNRAWMRAALSAALVQAPVQVGETAAWEAHDETCDSDNFATSIYEAGYDGLLVARCNQNGNHPWQAAAIIRGLTVNKALPHPETASVREGWRPTTDHVIMDAASKVKLWFFRDLSDGQRRGLFSLFGMPTKQLDTHGTQGKALRHILDSLAARPRTEGREE